MRSFFSSIKVFASARNFFSLMGAMTSAPAAVTALYTAITVYVVAPPPTIESVIWISYWAIPSAAFSLLSLAFFVGARNWD